MRESDVVNWLHDEISSFLSGSSLVSLSTPDEHVGLAEDRNAPTYPFVGIQRISGVTDSAGVGNGEVFVDSVNYDVNDLLESVTFRRDITLRVEVIPVTDDDQQLRDDLTSDLSDHLAVIARRGEYPSDVDDVSVGDSDTVGRSDEFVRANGVTLDIEYSRYYTDDDVPVAETVNLDVDVTDDPDTATDADAFDESF